MAQESAAFAAVFGNGPVIAGLAGGVDKFSVSKDGISVPEAAAQRGDINKIAALTFEQLPPKKYAYPRALIRAAIALAMASPELCVNGVNTRPVPANHPKTDDWMQGSPMIDEEAVILAITVICATKATWWMTNHHTGQGEPTGYFRKWVEVNKTRIGYDALAQTEKDELINIFWRIGHWFDTRVILAGLGINDIDVEPARVQVCKRYFLPAPDLVLRLQSNPAGSAKICDLAVAAQLLHASVYRSVVPYTPAYADLIVWRKEIIARPTQFHEGAHYLTGNNRAALPPIDDAIAETLNTYIQTVRGRSTLAQAIVFKKGSINAELEARFKAISKALLESKSSEEDMKKLLAASTEWPQRLE